MKTFVILITGLIVMAGTIFYISPLSQTKSAPKVLETAPQIKSSKYFYPLPDYESRIQERKHGQYFRAGDKVDASCGKPFQGFHAGDDLETSDSEREIEIPVVAIAKGKLLQIGFVGGYGGLVVQETKLDNDPVTVYYGHMDLSSVDHKPGDTVEAGETLGNLGDECSTETDDARKHLHFAIRKGPDVDVRGYVPTEAVLSNWLNPQETLKDLNATP